MNPYHPHSVITGRVLVGVLVALLASLLVGIAAAAFSRLVILIPTSLILMALGGGLAASAAITAGRVRSAAVAVLIGLLIGIVAWGTYRTANYVGEIIALTIENNESYPIKNNQYLAAFEASRMAIDESLKREVGQSGPVGYWEYEVYQGYELTSERSSTQSTTTLDSTATRIYHLAELAALIIVAVLSGVGKARTPYNEAESRWFTPKDFQAIGRFKTSSFRAMNKALKNGDYTRVRELFSEADKRSYSTVEGAQLNDGSGNILVKVASRNGRREQGKKFGVMPLEDFRQLQAAASVQSPM